MSAADDVLSASRSRVQHETRVDDQDPALASWLVWLSQILAGARCVALVEVYDDGAADVVAHTPSDASLPQASLALALRAHSQGTIQRCETDSFDVHLLAIPAEESPEPGESATVLMLLTGKQNRQQQCTLVSLARWALKSRAWVQARPGSWQMTEPAGVQQILNQLSESFAGAQCALTQLQGARSGRRKARVLYISGQQKPDPARPAVRQLASLVEARFGDARQPLTTHRDESADEQAPSSSSRGRNSASMAKLFVPIILRSQYYVILVQYPAAPPLVDGRGYERIRQVTPALQCALLLREADAPMLRIAVYRTRQWYDKLASRVIRTVAQIVFVLAAGSFLLVPVDHRVAADVVVEAAERHVLIAPVDGSIKSVLASAGDSVSQGQLLATLDDATLQQQAEKWLAEQQKNEQEYLRALAQHDRVELSSLRESLALIKAELAQIRTQQSRHELRAPMSGIVLSDAVEDALGSAVAAGDVLFVVGSDGQHRLALQMPERTVRRVASGQSVSLRMTAEPGQRRHAVVDTLIPVAVAHQGQNTFKVYASTDEHDSALRPGMKGIAKVLVGHESRLNQWAGSLWSRCVWLAWKLGISA